MPVVDYITKQMQITNLKVGGDLGLKEGKPIPLHIAVRKDIKILAGILEKGMKTITDDELRALQEKWLGTKGLDRRKPPSQWSMRRSPPAPNFDCLGDQITTP